MMGDLEARVSVVEERANQHDRQYEETQGFLRKLANGLNILVRAEAKREADREALKRAFIQIERLQRNFETLQKAFTDHQASQMTRELKAYKSIVWKIAGLFLIFLAALIASKFGVRLIDAL